MSLDIRIQTIPHSKQRYDTVGDWYFKNGRDFIRISNCKNRQYEMLLAIHELVEKFLCEAYEISPGEVDRFDMNFKGKDEPGDDPQSPYRQAHCFATAVERMLCAAMGISWKEYDDFVSKLG